METKKMVSRRDFLRVSALGSAGVLAAACGQPESTVVEVEVTRVVEVAAPAQERTTVRIGGWWGDLGRLFAPILMDKTNTNIVYEYASWPQWHEKMLLQLVAGTAPDFLCIGHPWMGALFPKSQLLPLNPYLETYGFDRDLYYWDPIEDVSGYGEDILCLEQFPGVGNAFYINREMTDELGITDMLPTVDKPDYDTWGWDDVVEFLEAGTKKRADGTVEQWGCAQSLSRNWLEWIYSNGAQRYDSMWGKGDETVCTLDSPEAIEAMDKAVQVVKDELCYLELISGPIEGGAYQGRKAVSHYGPIGVGWLRTEEMGWEQLYIKGPVLSERYTMAGQNFMGINKAAQEPEAALDVLFAWMMDEDVARRYIRIEGLTPAYNSRKWHDELDEGSEVSIVTAIGLSRWPRFTRFPDKAATVVYPGQSGFKVGSFLNDAMHAAMESAVLGKQTTEEAVKEAVVGINAELERVS